MNNGKEEFEKVVANLYEILRRLADKDPEALTSATEHVVATKYKLTKQVPIWTVFAGFALTWVVIFIGYSIALHNKSGDVLEQLNQILQ